MADNKQDTAEGIQLEGGLNRVERFFEENQNTVAGILGAVVIIVAGFVLYNRFVVAPKAEEAGRMVYKAQQWFEQDSFRLALEGDGNYYGFYDILDDYGSTPVGKLSQYYAGICNLQLGNYDEAISHLSRFRTGDPNLQAVAFGGIGDAHAQLGEMNEAVNYYKKAADRANIGTIAPIYYLRAGKAYEELEDFSAAGDMYQAVVSRYPEAPSMTEAEKHLSRIEAMLN